MHQIMPYLLWVGHAGDGRDFRRIHDMGIQAMVQLAIEEPAVQPPREFIYCRFPLLDGAGNSEELLGLAIGTLAALLRTRVPTLVFCGMGMSRSPAVTAAALAALHRQPAAQYLEEVTRHQPSDVSPALWGELTRLLRSGLPVSPEIPEATG